MASGSWRSSVSEVSSRKSIGRLAKRIGLSAGAPPILTAVFPLDAKLTATKVNTAANPHRATLVSHGDRTGPSSLWNRSPSLVVLRRVMVFIGALYASRSMLSMAPRRAFSHSSCRAFALADRDCGDTICTLNNRQRTARTLTFRDSVDKMLRA